MSLSRRDLIRVSAIGAGVVGVGNLAVLTGCAPSPTDPTVPPAGGYGPLVPDPAGLLDLPAGFTYSIVSQAGDPLPGGGSVPDRFDGTAAFAGPGGGVRLVRNHEQSTGAARPVVGEAAVTYDPGAQGGTTTVTLDAAGARVDEYVSLAGTYNNCAGGPTPWGTWLTCEETEVKAGGALTKDHGFVFEVDPNHPERNAGPVPLTAMGRFAHEAVAVDPYVGDVYLTEDASNPNGLVYRFTPHNSGGGHGSLRDGGTLYAMRCALRGTFVPDLSVFTEPGTKLSVTWSPVPDPLASSRSTRKQFDYAANPNSDGGGATRSRKFEGCWWGDGKIHIVCSFARVSDGSAAEHDGQVWAYDPVAKTLTLEVRFSVNSDTSSDLPDGPDNITVSPWGGFILAEDGEGVQHLLTVDERGGTTSFARNRRDDGEFAGPVFSPNASTLFANLQEPGVTFAITGPFSTLA